MVGAYIINYLDVGIIGFRNMSYINSITVITEVDKP